MAKGRKLTAPLPHTSQKKSYWVYSGCSFVILDVTPIVFLSDLDLITLQSGQIKLTKSETVSWVLSSMSVGVRWPFYKSLRDVHHSFWFQVSFWMKRRPREDSLILCVLECIDGMCTALYRSFNSVSRSSASYVECGHQVCFSLLFFIATLMWINGDEKPWFQVSQNMMMYCYWCSQVRYKFVEHSTLWNKHVLLNLKTKFCL